MVLHLRKIAVAVSFPLWIKTRKIDNRIMGFVPLLKSTIHQLILFSKNFNSWSLAIKNASSPKQALTLYSKMQKESVPFDSFSILFTLKSCTHLRNLALIQHLHAHIFKIGFCFHIYVADSLLHNYAVLSLSEACTLFDEMPVRNSVSWNTMITGFSRFGDADKAKKVFDEMPLKDTVSWSAMIAGYVSNGYWTKGLKLFSDMVVNGEVKPDQVTLGSVLSACAHMGSIGSLLGKSVHGFIVKNEWELDVEAGTVLVDMYAKCGVLKNASLVFDMMEDRNVMSWTALICGAAQHGYGREALVIFNRMKEMGVKPNELTFTGILSACAQAGLIKEGRKYFNMIEECGLEPRIQHYGCMVDLLGKAGRLEEAYEIIKSMKLKPNVAVWGSFLQACKFHKQYDMAYGVVEWILGIVKPETDGGIYTLICDLYALGEKWDDAERVRKLMVNNNVKKISGLSFIRSGTM